MPTAISTMRGVFQAMGVSPLKWRQDNDVGDSKRVSRFAGEPSGDHLHVLIVQRD
jgi:hypothetical protein